SFKGTIMDTETHFSSKLDRVLRRLVFRIAPAYRNPSPRTRLRCHIMISTVYRKCLNRMEETLQLSLLSRSRAIWVSSRPMKDFCKVCVTSRQIMAHF